MERKGTETRVKRKYRRAVGSGFDAGAHLPFCAWVAIRQLYAHQMRMLGCSL